MDEHNTPEEIDIRIRLPLPIVVPVAIVAAIALGVIVISRILLDVPEGIAAVIAAVTALNFLGAFGYIATRDNVSAGRVLEVFAIALYPLVIGAVIAFVGFGTATTGKAAAGGGASQPHNTLTDITVSAQNVAFDTKTITAAAGKKITVHFDNKDSSSVDHNIAFYSDKSAKQTIYKGKVIPGGSTADYSFKTPTKPGSYFFRCDVHPTSMFGTFVVKK